MSFSEPVEPVESAEPVAPTGPHRPVAPVFTGATAFREGDESGARSMRPAVLLVATGLLATMGWVGVYLMAFGSGDASASAERSIPVGLTPGASADQAAGTSAAKKMFVAAKARAAAKALPKGKLNDNDKRLALKRFTDAIGLDLSTTASPPAAARSACRLLGTGTEPEHLVEGVAKGGKISKAQSRAFLFGATSIYCPGEAKPFRR
jgi:hypothetical protein